MIERRLRLRAEGVVGRVATVADSEVMADLDAFQAAALAAARVGAVAEDAAARLVDDVVDALVLRGATWITPSVPDLDLAGLHARVTTDRRAVLERVVPVAARLGAVVVASAEVWSDRIVARTRLADGSPGADLVVGPSSTPDRSLQLSDGAGNVLGVDLRTGVAAGPGRMSEATSTAEDDLVALVAVERAGLVGASVAEATLARSRLIAVGEVLCGVVDPALVAGFDAAWAATTTAPAGAAELQGVVALARRLPDGWLLSLERWAERTRVVWAPDRVPQPPALWTLDDGGPGLVGGLDEGGTLVFEGAPAEGRLVLRRYAGGRMVAIEVST